MAQNATRIAVSGGEFLSIAGKTITHNRNIKGAFQAENTEGIIRVDYEVPDNSKTLLITGFVANGQIEGQHIEKQIQAIKDAKIPEAVFSVAKREGLKVEVASYANKWKKSQRLFSFLLLEVYTEMRRFEQVPREIFENPFENVTRKT